MGEKYTSVSWVKTKRKKKKQFGLTDRKDGQMEHTTRGYESRPRCSFFGD
jgi:hypothetical protein